MIGGCFAYKNELETFANNLKNNGIYQEWNQNLNDMKLSHNVGMPNGILKINPNASKCETDKNLMIQSNVAFRPHRNGPGFAQACTYIDKQWPIA